MDMGLFTCLVELQHDGYLCLISELNLTNLDLGPPAPLGALFDEESRSITVTGDPTGSMRADSDTHIFQVFF